MLYFLLSYVMITFEMFGSDNIRVKIKDFLRNITENQTLKIDSKGIKNKNKITYSFDDVKYTIKTNNNNILLTRESDEFLNNFSFGDKTCSSYLLKENNFNVDININTIDIDIKDNYIYVKYEIIDTKCIYEYKIEMSEF